MEGTVKIPSWNFLSIQGALSLSALVVILSQPAIVEGADATLRYLTVNVGNASIDCAPFENKLCKEQDVLDLRSYIETWQPEIVLLSEVYREDQLTGTAMFGPILPDGYSGVCGESRDRYTGELVDWDAPDASHEHECVAWKTASFELVPGSERSAYGRNDAFGQSNCVYDFTGFRVMLTSQEGTRITAVTVHPDSVDACRDEEIGRYWGDLATGEFVVIGGDWNAESDGDLQVPSRFDVNFSRGRHGDLAEHPGDYSAVYGAFRYHVDHAFSNFGTLCTTCGGGAGGDLAFGSALGGYDGHPRADDGEGMDHRQILVDLQYSDRRRFWPSYLRDNARSGYNPDEQTARPPYVETWSRPVGSTSDDGLVVAAGLIFVTASSSADNTLTVTAIDVPTGVTVWETVIQGTSAFGAPAEADGTLYVLTREYVESTRSFLGHLSTLAVADGALQSDTVLPFVAIGDPVVDGDKIYLHSRTGLHALDRESMSVLWSYAPGGADFDSDLIVVNGILVTAAGDAGTVAVDSDTGEELWAFPQNPDTWFHDLSASVNWNLVFLPTTTRSPVSTALRALDARTGELQWLHSYDAGTWGAVNPVTDGDRVYHIRSAYENTKIFVFDARTGAVLHEFPIPYVNGDYTFLTLANGVLYATTNQWYEYPLVQAFDASTGELLWESPDIEASTSPIVVAWGNVFALGIPPFGDPSLRLIAYGLDLVAGPDLEVFGIDFTSEPTPDEPTTAVASLRNNGDTPTEPFNVRWFLDGDEVGYGNHASLSPGEISTDNVRYVWTPTPGVHTLRFEADVDNDVLEPNEDNNFFSIDVEVGTQPDLEAGSITFAPPPVLGQLTTARVDVANRGTGDSGPFQVTWYLDSSAAVSERRTTPLPAGGAIAFEFSIDVQAEHEVRVVVDSLDEVIESNESNNESVTTMELVPGSDRLSLSVSPKALVTNAEGWYENNPVTIEAVATCPVGSLPCHDPFLLEIGGGGRFYVYETDTGEDVICPINMGEPYSLREVESRCESIPGSGDLILLPGESVTLRFSLWMQPTHATSLQVSATWGAEAASETVSIPAASIHPIVVIHGILGSQHPQDLLVTDQDTMHDRFDPFLGIYRPLFNQLQKMGYEWNQTLFGLTYDWRQNNELSAAHLRAQLSGAIIPRSRLPYVAAEPKADLVVHSMGGLVSRAYIQGPDYQNDVNKVIFTATPHKGFPFDYRTWEGMDWSNYLYDAWVSAGSTVALTPLMNNVLWPMQVYKKYRPDQAKLDDECFFLPTASQIPWPYLKVFYFRDGVVPGHYYCDKDAVAKWAHDGDAGIPSLQQMLPTPDMPQYLTASGGPPPYGVETNVWLENLNANIQNLVDSLGGEDKLFTIYGDEIPETDFSYEVDPPFGLTPNVWRHGRVWGGAFGLGESSFGNIEEAANGDDLVPAASACLSCGSNPLIPTLPGGNDYRIAGATHKGILGHSELQTVALPNFLAAQSVPFTSPRPYTIVPLIRLLVIYSQCPVNLLVENAAGQRLGFDPASGEVYREIENAMYSGPAVESQFIVLADPDPETLNLLIAGYDSGEYSVRGMMIDEGGLFEAASFFGTTVDGQRDEEVIEVPAPTIVPSIAVAAPSVKEGSGEAEFTVTLSESVDRPIGVEFSTVNQTAIAPADYEAEIGAVTFEPGETEKTLAVPLHDDTLYEGDETFALIVVNPFSGEHLEAVATIVDDDPLPMVKVGDATVVEGASGTTTEAHFALTLSSPSAFGVELLVQTVEGTASPEDFIPKAGVVTIPPGEDSLLVPVTVLGDDLLEGNESFSLHGSECFVRISASLGEPCTFLDEIGLGTILDDDEEPTTVSLEDARPVTEPEPGKETKSVFRARLSTPSAYPVVLSYETEDGSATGGEDYAVTRETVTVPAGETEVAIPIAVFGDRVPERTEVFFLRLTACRHVGQSHPCRVSRDRARGVVVDGDVRTNYRSIGIHRGTLYDEGIAVWTGANRFAIRGGRLPENVGIGDAFILDPGRDQVELYILARLDGTHVLVQQSLESPPSGVRYAIRRAYRELDDWERERDGELVRERRREVGVLYNDGPFRGKPAHSLLTIEGSRTNERYYMKLMAAPGHEHRAQAGTGVVLDGRGKIKLGIQVRDRYTQIEGLELRGFSSENGAAAIEVRYARHVLLDRLLIHDFKNKKATVVGVKGSYQSQFTLRNSIIYDGDAAGVRINRDSGRATIDNCTVFGMDGRGIYEDDGKMRVRNSISMNNGQDDFDVTRWRQSHNMSSDGTASGKGAIPFARAKEQFVSLERGKEDFHLRSGADAIDRGMDRSEDFANDVDGDPRPQGADWDMGADERRPRPEPRGKTGR